MDIVTRMLATNNIFIFELHNINPLVIATTSFSSSLLIPL